MNETCTDATGIKVDEPQLGIGRNGDRRCERDAAPRRDRHDDALPVAAGWRRAIVVCAGRRRERLPSFKPDAITAFRWLKPDAARLGEFGGEIRPWFENDVAVVS